MRNHIKSVLATALLSLSLLLPTSFAQQEQTDKTMDKLQKLLEERESSSSQRDSGKNDDTDALEEANKKLHGGQTPEERERKKPGKVLDQIIDDMDTAARSLETNVQKLQKIKSMLKDLQLNTEERETLSEKQKKIIRKLNQLFDESKQNQQNVSDRLRDLISFKDQLSSVKSSQKQSISNIEKLLKLTRKQSSSGTKSQRPKRRKRNQKKNQSQARKKNKQKQQQKPARQRKNKNQPADKPYEAQSTPPENVKTYSTGDTKRWGNLPDYVRKKVIQRQNEEYVPEYSNRLRQYYKKIGENSGE